MSFLKKVTRKEMNERFPLVNALFLFFTINLCDNKRHFFQIKITV